MKKLEIEPTTNSPHILFDADKGKFLIEGKSFPEDSKTFFLSVIDWLKEYKKEKPENFELDINLFYLTVAYYLITLI